MKIFKRKPKKEENEVIQDPTFVEEQKKNLEEQLKELNPISDEYNKIYDQYLKVQDSEIKEETLEGKKIENANKKEETNQKNKDRKAGIAKTAISAAAGVVAAVLIPLTEQKIGPGMSKLSNHAQANIFKRKD